VPVVTRRDTRLSVLGPVEVLDAAGDPVPIGGHTQTVLLGLLASEANRPVPAHRLIELLWPDQTPKDPAGALQNRVSRLRRVVDGDGLRLVKRPSGYQLDAAPGVLDALVFEDAVRRADPDRVAPDELPGLLGPALALWRGEPYLGLHGVAPLRHAAARLRELKLSWLERTAERLTRSGAAEIAVARLRGVVAEAPLREQTRVLLMLALAALGRTAEAVGLYHEYREFLADRTGLSPSAEAEEVYQGLLRGAVAAASRVAPVDPLDRPEAPRLVLAAVPEPITPILGRERELVDLVDLVGRGHRLVTLTGPGGVGKTRLATELVRRKWTGEAALVPLAAVTRPGDVPDAVARALGVPLTTGDAGADLAAAVGETAVLLLVDDVEPGHAAGPLLARLLGACPSLRIVATAREPIGLPGESEYAVTPLAVPAADARPDDVLASPAASLFLDRLADRSAPGPAAARIGELCRRLGGLPLAIELAAALARCRSLDEVFDAMARSFGRSEDDALGSAIGWSCAQLSTAERDLLRKLSLFAAPVDRTTAGTVAGSGTAGSMVERLVRLGLLQPHRDGDEVRYAVPGIVAAYVAQRLATPAERAADEAAHFRWHAGLCADPHWLDDELLARVDRAYPDCVRALDHGLSHPGADTEVLDLGIALLLHWLWRSDSHQGSRWLDRLEPRFAGVPGPAARLAVLRAGFERGLGRTRQATRIVESHLGALAGDSEWLVTGALLLAIAADDRGDRADVVRWAEEAVRVAGDGAPRRLPEALGVLSAAYGGAGDHEAAAREAMRALDLLDGVASPALRAVARANAGQALTEAGRAVLALEVLQSGLEELRDAPSGLDHLHLNIGWARLGAGDHAGALDAFRTFLDEAAGSGQWLFAAELVAGSACALVGAGRVREGALALGGAERMLRRLDMRPSPWIRARLDDAYAVVAARPDGTDLVHAGGQLRPEALADLVAGRPRRSKEGPLPHALA